MTEQHTAHSSTSGALRDRDHAKHWTGRRRILLSIFVASQLLMVITIVILVSALVVVSQSWSIPRVGVSVQEVVEQLRSNRLHQGMELPDDLPKPWIINVQDGVEGQTVVFVVRDRSRIVQLYASNNILFAACTIEGNPNWNITWHFCDTDLLGQHIENSTYPN